jgi:hypothetical protein
MFAGGAGEGKEGQAGEGARETGAAGAGGARTEVLLIFFLNFFESLWLLVNSKDSDPDPEGQLIRIHRI